jgi:hypothetical protein
LTDTLLLLLLVLPARHRYQYRLCKAEANLTEQCFQQRPVPFVGQSSLRWGGAGGKQIFFNVRVAPSEFRALFCTAFF